MWSLQLFWFEARHSSCTSHWSTWVQECRATTCALIVSFRCVGDCFVSMEVPASIETTMSLQDIVTRWRVSQLFYFIVSADRSSECQHMIECMFQGTLLEEPSLCISAFLGVAFNSSANAISGKPAIINGSVKICRVILLQGFFKQCLEDGWLNLPTPLNKETKHALVMASSYWLYWLRVPGQSFADLRSGVKLWQRCRLQQTLESKKAQLKNAQ